MDQRYTKKAKLDQTTKDIWIGVILLVVFLVIFYGCSKITARISDGVVTARFFPYLVAGFGSALSGWMIIANLYKKYYSEGEAAAKSKQKATANTAVEEKDEAANPDSAIRWNMIALSIVFMAGYLLLIDILGFIVSSAIYLMVQILVLQQNRTVKRVIMVVVISIVVPVIIYLPFRYIFSLMLPLGIFK